MLNYTKLNRRFQTLGSRASYHLAGDGTGEARQGDALVGICLRMYERVPYRARKVLETTSLGFLWSLDRELIHRRFLQGLVSFPIDSPHTPWTRKTRS